MPRPRCAFEEHRSYGNPIWNIRFGQQSTAQQEWAVEKRGAQRCKYRGEALKQHRNLETRSVAEEQQISSSEAGVEAAFAPASVARPVKGILDKHEVVADADFWPG